MNPSSPPPAQPASLASENGQAPATPPSSAFARVLVGFDDQPGSRDALTLAAALADASAAELVVASVRPYWPESIPPGDYGRIVAEEEDWARRAASATLGTRSFETRVIAGGPAGEGLKEIAAAEGADLIVLGSTHRGPVGRVLLGSVGERVVDGAPCAVAIAPRGLADGELSLRHIVVGCDGSKDATAALESAAALAGRSGARLTLVGVVEMRFDLAGFARPAAEAEIARIQQALARARQSLPANLAVDEVEVHGVASDVITALGRDADLLVLGSRGHYGLVRRLFLGSVAARVARTAPCATLIVPTA